MRNNRLYGLSRIAGAWFLIGCTAAGAAEKAPAPTITGAGEHFTWVLLDEIRPQLERDQRLDAGAWLQRRHQEGQGKPFR